MSYTQTRARGREGGGWAQEMPREGSVEQEEDWMSETSKWEALGLLDEEASAQVEFINQELQEERTRRKFLG